MREEVTKLKQDHAKEIENLVRSHRVELLELKNEFKLKEIEIEKVQKTKTLALEKEVQRLRNDIEMMKLTAKHKQTEADEKIQEVRNQMGLMKIECEREKCDLRHELEQQIQKMKLQIELLEMDKAEPDQKPEQGINLKQDAAVLDKNKVSTQRDLPVTRNNKLEKGVTLQQTEQVTRTNNNKASTLRDTPTVGSNKENCQRLLEGANRFFGTGQKRLYPGTYQQWYQDLSNSMENHRQYSNDKFVLIRKEIKKYSEYLSLILERGKLTEETYDLVVEGLNEKILSESEVLILHPQELGKYLKITDYHRRANYSCWAYNGVTKDFYFGQSYSVIILVAKINNE